MAADLVAVADFLAFPGVDPTTNTTLAEDLLEAMEDRLELVCNRTRRRWRAAQTGRTEYQDGTGTNRLWLDYPISVLTSVKLGYLPATPDETLDVADQSALVWAADDARLRRVDGGVFGCLHAPRYVQVVYNAAADLPGPAAQAVMSLASAVLQQAGSEGVSSERIGAYSYEIALNLAEKNEAWQAAVDAYRVRPI